MEQQRHRKIYMEEVKSHPIDFFDEERAKKGDGEFEEIKRLAKAGPEIAFASETVQSVAKFRDVKLIRELCKRTGSDDEMWTLFTVGSPSRGEAFTPSYWNVRRNEKKFDLGGVPEFKKSILEKMKKPVTEMLDDGTLVELNARAWMDTIERSLRANADNGGIKCLRPRRLLVI
jgi:transposase-like protein